MRVIELSGQTFGRWTVISYYGKKWNNTCWNCRCECGTEKVIQGSKLKNGTSMSCGCLQAELLSERSMKHGMFGTPTYSAWASMMARCFNPKNDSFKHYGARGITVCERWFKFENFLADIGAKPNADLSLERENNNGNYEPGNCVWADAIAQHNNTRRSITKTFNGETLTIAQWARRSGLRVDTLWRRLKSGWSIERALTKPI